MHGRHACCANADKDGGLIRTSHICVGARFMLTVNVNADFGLINGSIGTIVEIIYPNGLKPQDCQPSVVLVDFPKYKGPPFLMNHPTFVPVIPVPVIPVPVIPVARRLDCGCCKRKQVPL